MSDRAPMDSLIDRLSRDLRPVKRLLPPWLRAAQWLGGAVALAVPLSLFADWHGIVMRLMAAPDMWLSQLGALLTAVTAALAAFLTSVPGRSRLVPLLPLPPACLWVSASTAGCLRLTGIAGTVPEPATHPIVCLNFLLLVSVPLGVLMTFLLARAFPLRPGLTAALAGLACAGAASCLLTFIHPFDATAEDLLVHLAAVMAVVMVTRFIGGRWIERAERRLRRGNLSVP